MHDRRVTPTKRPIKPPARLWERLVPMIRIQKGVYDRAYRLGLRSGFEAGYSDGYRIGQADSEAEKGE